MKAKITRKARPDLSYYGFYTSKSGEANAEAYGMSLYTEIDRDLLPSTIGKY